MEASGVGKAHFFPAFRLPKPRWWSAVKWGERKERDMCTRTSSSRY